MTFQPNVSWFVFKNVPGYFSSWGCGYSWCNSGHRTPPNCKRHFGVYSSPFPSSLWDLNILFLYGHINFLQVVSGDLVSDVPLGAVAATHRRHDAVVTAMLCSAPVSGPLESGSSGGKDKTKKPGRYDLIGLDPTKQFLLHIATG